MTVTDNFADNWLGSMTLSDFLEKVAAPTPSPGGGAVAAATGGLAAALAGMVVTYSHGSRRAAGNEEQVEAAGQWLREKRQVLLKLAAADARAYGEVARLYRLPADDPERAGGLQEALRQAIEPPLTIVEVMGELVELCATLAPITKQHLRSDLMIAATLAEATARAAGELIAVNVKSLDRGGDGQEMEKVAGDIANRATARLAALQARDH